MLDMLYFYMNCLFLLCYFFVYLNLMCYFILLRVEIMVYLDIVFVFNFDLLNLQLKGNLNVK